MLGHQGSAAVGSYYSLLSTPIPKEHKGKNSVSEADLELEPEKRAADRTCGYKGVQNHSADTRTNKPAFPSPDLGSSQCLHRPTQRKLESRRAQGI